MKPKIIHTNPITLIGMSFYGDPFDVHSGWDEDNQIGLLWKRFMAFISNAKETEYLSRNHKAFYEVHIYSPETRERGLFEVFVGVEFDPQYLKNVPAELCLKNLPATQYAVFTFNGDQISSDWEKTLQDWLATSEYLSDGSYGIQYLDERFKGVHNLRESALDVYIPVKKKQD